MCGVMGIISQSEVEDFSSAFATIKPRGPDASADWRGEIGQWQARLGHHRLSIIDVAGGAQPMTRGETTVIYNGEVYNFKELAATMSTTTQSDTEVILQMFRHRGVESFSRWDGFFAAGFVDTDKRELTLVRDPWGIKPMYYAPLADGGLMFASELKPFLQVKAINRKLSAGALYNYLFWEHYPDEKTPLEGVFKLRPGFFLVWREGKFRTQRYFDPFQLLRQPRRKFSKGELWSTIAQSVDRAMISDVPVGILLSGGIDSSLVALAAYDVKGKGIPTFSIGFSDSNFDESVYAKEVAKIIQADHTQRILTENDLVERWQDIIDGLDEPMADPSIIPTRILCELAREKVKVVLGGDGGDELFGGYPTYRAHRAAGLLSSIPQFVLEPARRLVNDHLKMSDAYQPLAWKLKRLIGRFDRDPLFRHWRWMSGADLPQLRELFASSGPEADDHAALIAEAEDFKMLDSADLQTYMLMDLTHYLPYSVLAKVDRASMAVGIECRPPILSRSVVEMAFQIPVAQKVSIGQTKLILRELARERLPKSIHARSKRGFAIPLRSWLKGPLRTPVESMLKNSILFDGRAGAGGFLNGAAAHELWRQFLDGSGDHSRLFWSLLVFDRWAQRNAL